MKTWLLAHAFGLISGPIVGVLVFFFHEQLQKAWGWLDAQPPLVKRLAAFVLAAILAPVTTVLGVAVPAACSAVPLVATDCLAVLADQSWLTVAVGGGVALLAHKILQPGSQSVG